jgi:glutamyl-tRNA synthetase
MNTRVRFAPSPTGPLHIGGLRTALFNYLFAKKKGGTFVLRIEDTDQNRYVEGSEDYIQEALEWCGMSPDEGPKNDGKYGPYRQSERKSIYEEHIQTLLKNGAAYYAFDKTEQLNEERKEAEKKGQTFKYGNQNRLQFKNSLTLTEKEAAEALKNGFVIRLKVEPDETVIVKDIIRGVVRVETNSLDDKILMKSDGMPTYHFANVVDDHLMKITCVIRGEEWLPSLPMHKLIYTAFGWETPEFMHLPLILKTVGKGKMSKRDGDKEGYPVFPLKWGKETLGFREMGFLASGVVNYLALLGWNEGTEKEVYSLKELEKAFSTDGVQKGGAKFDYEKAKWVNQQQLQKMSIEEIYSLSKVKILLSPFKENKHLSLIKLIKKRLNTLNDIKDELAFIKNTHPYDQKVIDKIYNKNPKNVLEQIKKTLIEEEDVDLFKEQIISWSKKNEVSIGLLMQSFRLALVGRLMGPDIFEICSVLGKEVSLKRINKLIEHLNFKQIL